MKELERLKNFHDSEDDDLDGLPQGCNYSPDPEEVEQFKKADKAIKVLLSKNRKRRRGLNEIRSVSVVAPFLLSIVLFGEKNISVAEEVRESMRE